MDEELEASGVRQTSVRENLEEEEKKFSRNAKNPEDTVKIDPQVLSSLLKSLEAKTGVETEPVISKLLPARNPNF
jgi:hypothetical protein